jgi:murein DD-endopeptidase
MRGDMKIKWDVVFENEKRQFEKMTEQDKFIYFLLLQFGSPYGWGKENPESSDCSGAVCLALYAATGLLIRTTADDLYKRVFTKLNPGAADIRAAFFIDGATGKAGHVAGLVGDGVALNSQEGGARVCSLERLSAWFWERGASTAVRGLDRAALARMAAEGARDGVDSEIGEYFTNEK